MEKENIKKVHVVYKTHLDIGFTDFGETVLKRYMEEYIPHSIQLAMELNTVEHKKFIWTLGSYLIDYYLMHAEEAKRKELEEAIEKGFICWHGLSCTTHTELLDQKLFQYDLHVGKRLDHRFHKNTISAKMTDVPGHTIAMVDELCKNGIRFLHIGVNASSGVPEVPETFLWKHGKQELIVQYAAQYGASGYVEGMDEVLEFAHTGDNLGPQSAKDIEAEFARLQKKYPNAIVEASTMDAYAESLLKIKDTLPVVEEEIGDTWIHGIASDPWKIVRYRELLQLRDVWMEEGKMSEESPYYDEFMMNLLLIAEHTWGLDFKKYLADFKNWKKEDFQKARKEDGTTLEYLTNRNAQMLEVLKTDIEHYRGGVFTGSYKAYEASHEEQRQYLKKACKNLPEELKQEAEERMNALTPVFERMEGTKLRIGQKISLGPWRVAFAGNGSITYLEKNGKIWVQDGAIGYFQYEIYSALECVQSYYRYNREFYQNECWSEGDFSKPGLEFVEGLKHRVYEYGVESIVVQGEKILVTLYADEEAASLYGAPRCVQVCYWFGEKIQCSLRWMEKDANKIPEALWFGFQFDVENANRWRMCKMGTEVSPLEVVRGGNRLQHCVEAMKYQGADGSILVQNMHTPLVSVGGKNLYSDYKKNPDMEKGFQFNLFNNKWGTNFSMWSEDACRAEYVITLS